MKRYATVTNLTSKFKTNLIDTELRTDVLSGENEADNLPAVQVSCRLRPLNDKEKKSDALVPWSYTSTQIRITKKINKCCISYKNTLSNLYPTMANFTAN